jgi:predicted phosphate transport protein (TIGR00153 family)
MQRVMQCVRKLPAVFEAVKAEDTEKLAAMVKQISKLEHEADLVKNDIRSSLKGHLFLPVDRLGLLDILGLQDNLADQAEDIGILLTFRKPHMPAVVAEGFDEFLEKSLETCEEAARIIDELQELIESSFGGVEANKVRQMVDHVAFREHEIDVLQREMLKRLFNTENELVYTEFALWIRIIGEISMLSNLSEKLANRVLVTMEIK